MIEVQMGDGTIYLTDAIAVGIDFLIFSTYDLMTEETIQRRELFVNVMRIIPAGQKMKYELF